jgi:hypothetical protein
MRTHPTRGPCFPAPARPAGQPGHTWLISLSFPSTTRGPRCYEPRVALGRHLTATLTNQAKKALEKKAKKEKEKKEKVRTARPHVADSSPAEPSPSP